MNVLIAYGTTEGQTAHIADELQRQLANAGVSAEAVDLEKGQPEVAAFDRVVIAGSVHMGKFQKEVSKFVSAHVGLLNEVPSWFVGISMAEAGGKTGGHDTAQAIIDSFVSEHGWRPKGTLSLAGALKYREYNILTRFLMKRISAAEGRPTDTSRDWEFTDWGAVERLASEIAATAVRA